MKKVLSVFLCLFCLFGAFAAENATVEQCGWMSVDFAYYFDSARNNQAGTTWAGVTGIYGGLEGRITPWYEAKVNIPGNGALTAGNNIKFQQGLEVTPVSVMSKSAIRVTPIAFLNFSAGVNVGTGWDLGPFKGGMGELDATATATNVVDGALKEVYTPYTPAFNLYIEPWIEALFQFDVAALMPADKQDWTHVVLMATFKVMHKSMTGAEDSNIWTWQLSGDQMNGLYYDSVITLGYMFPEQVKVISLAGVQVEFDGALANGYSVKSSPLTSTYTNMCTIGISPTAVLKFNDHHSLGCQVRFKNRRSFATEGGIENATIVGTCIGQEFYFDRLALSYTWSF